MRATHALGSLALGLALAVGLTACGDDGGDSSAKVSATEHNDADVAFAGDMIQHHAQALSMVDLTMDRPLNPEVEALAEDIRAAQAPEIETLAGWLTDWDEQIPETIRDHVNAGHGAGDLSDSMEDVDHGDMPGMMSADDIDALENAADTEFQEMWLEMMIEHHEGAIEMAKAEQEDGRYKAAVALAGDIVDSQSQEVSTMQGLLRS
jgi:uncharacterized protein (DUF305 family)